MANPRTVAQIRGGGRRVVPNASQIASAEAAIATTTLATTKLGAWLIWTLAGLARMATWCIDGIPTPIANAAIASDLGVLCCALAVKIANPTTSTQMNSETSVGKTI